MTNPLRDPSLDQRKKGYIPRLTRIRIERLSQPLNRDCFALFSFTSEPIPPHNRGQYPQQCPLCAFEANTLRLVRYILTNGHDAHLRGFATQTLNKERNPSQ